MTSSHSLDHWLLSHGAELCATGVTATAGRGPMMAGRPSATWISFQTPRSGGRLVLWSTGRCRLDAASHSGTQLCAADREVATTADLDEALTHLTSCLAGSPGE